MGLEQIVPAFFFIAILILILPEFIKSNVDLMKLIKKVETTDEKNSGSFNVYLKSKNKFR